MNKDSAESAMPSSARVARRIWWFTVSNAADRSRRMKTDERDEALAAGVSQSPQGELSQ